MLSFSATMLAATLLNLTAPEGTERRDWAPHDTVITMFRGGCERRCAVYRVAIFAGGTVIIEGRYYLRHPVLKTFEIEDSEVQRLINLFAAIDYFNLPDHFGYKGKGCTSQAGYDGPNVITTIVSGGRGKSMTHDLSCLGAIPDQLTALEHEIDLAANTKKWVSPTRHY